MEGAMRGLTSLKQRVCVRMLLRDGHKCQSLKNRAAKVFLKVVILTYQQGKQPSFSNTK